MVATASTEHSYWLALAFVAWKFHATTQAPANRSTYGHRAFSVAGPTTWNPLTDRLRDPPIYDHCYVSAASSKHFCFQIKLYIFSALEIFLLMRYTHLRFTCLLTYLCQNIFEKSVDVSLGTVYCTMIEEAKIVLYAKKHALWHWTVITPMVCLQCKNCVIHTWVLQRWASHNGARALYKCTSPLQIQMGICRAWLTNCPGALTKCQNTMWNRWAFKSFFWIHWCQ